jgi:hypothetical protein
VLPTPIRRHRRREKGPSAAIQYLRAELTKGFRPEAPAVADMLHEKTVIVKDNLNSKEWAMRLS